MRRVRFVSERVDDQQIQVSHLVQGLFRNLVAVGDECDILIAIAESETGHLAISVNHIKRSHAQPADFKFTIDRLRNELRQPASDMFRLENIGEDLAKIFPCRLATVYRYRSLPEIEGADVIEAKDVVGMTMSDQHSVQPVQMFAQSLLAKIHGDVDDQSHAIVFDEQSGAKAFIPGIV